MKRKKSVIRWLPQPENHDYPAALSYLGLVYSPRIAKRLVRRLKHAPLMEFKAKDIFRASALPLLPLRNAHVKQDEKRILARRDLSPILLVRDDRRGRVIIADGYHRLCAVYAFDEDAVIPCKIV